MLAMQRVVVIKTPWCAF